MAFSWWAVAEAVFKKIPFDRILVPPRDKTKALQEFVNTFQVTETKKEALSSQEATITTQKPEKMAEKPQEVRQGGSTGVLTREGLDPDTMRWQLQEARAELWELEGHLKHYCKECGADNSCCFKHSQNMIDLAQETKSMTTDPVWDKIITLGEEIKVKAHPDNIRAGTYFAEFPQLIVRVSELRKPIETQLIQLSKPELTLEEAKQLAAEEAAKEVERKWQSQEKK